MHTYIEIGNYKIPTYGICIMIGIVIANVIAYFIIRKKHMDWNDLIILEAYAFLGGFIGAKGLYLWVSHNQIDWSRITDFAYFNQVMRGGFVFYGGLIFGVLFLMLAGKIHKINSAYYIKEFIFLLPFAHAFGRIGCFMAGCCYGIPYDGIFSVVFPEGSLAPAGIRLFPVQTVEAAGLFIISLILFFLEIRRKNNYAVEIYIILYAVLRFVLEYFRYDSYRGKWLIFSTSQWISLIIVVAISVWIGVRTVIKKKNTSE